MKTTTKDFFLNLLVIATLYFAAGFLVNLLFAYIDLGIVDPLEGSALYRLGSVRWGVAALVIIFPVFVWASWFLNREFIKNPEMRHYRMRTWLLYLTLFIAGAVIIGDLVAVIYNFLEGDLTARFLLKVLAILIIAGSTFGYYLLEVRMREGGQSLAQRIIAWVMIAAVSIAILAGFFVAGSPFEQRAKRFDDRRVSDLQSIQWQIVNFWQRKEHLPDSLAELRDEISGFTAPSDPESGAAYEYNSTANLSFELCASFNRESADEASLKAPAYPDMTDGNWAHGAGRVCFMRTIDPDLYPPLEKPRVAPMQ